METRTRRVIINKGHFTRILPRQALDAFKVFWRASRLGTVATAAALVFSTAFAVSTKASCGVPTTPGLGVVLPESLGGTLAAAGKERPTINIVINRYAQVSDRTLGEAEAATTRVLSIAGIETRWRQSRESEADSNLGPNCCRLEKGATVFLLIIPRAMAAHLASGATSLGSAILPGAGKKGDMAYIFYHRVEELAATEEVSAAQVLGDAMAHEIGHLLLNSNTHTDVGIMQAEWHNEQMELLRNGRLLFTDIQARQMRAGVLAGQTETGILQSETTRN